MTDKYTSVGKGIPNIDSVDKVKGNAIFTPDIKITGMLHGRILRSPFPHSKILNIDVSKAERLKGVRAVITAKDTPLIKYSIIPSLADKLPLENEKVRFIGDEIAAVAAADEELAQEALELIRVEFEELPAVFDPIEAMAPNSPKIHEHLASNIAKNIEMECGDVEAAFEKADLVLEETFKTHAQSHCPLETSSCIASYDHNGNITVWTCNQAPHALRQRLSHSLKIDTSKIHVITPHIGGGFGSKIDLDPMHIISVILSKKTGKPVRIINTRREQFMATRMRHATVMEMKFGAKHDGTIVAKQARTIMDNGAYNSHGPAILAYNNVMFSSLYRIKNIKYEGYLVYTNKNYGGAFRGYGDPQATLAQEIMVDMLGEELGIDPIDLRIMNANRPNEITANSVRITSCGLKECLSEAKKSSNWVEKRGNGMRNRGIGVASMIYTGGGSIGSGFNYSGATIRINADGSLHLLVGAQDIGQGSNTILTQIAAEVLSVNVDAVRLTTSDTDTTIPCMGTFGSRVTFCSGNAVYQAANEARSELLKEASVMLNANIEELELKNKKISVKGKPDKLVTFSDIASIAYNEKKRVIVGHGYYNGPELSDDFDPVSYRGYPSPTMVFGTHIAEVEVDPGTGQVDILNFVAAHDLGKAINPLLAQGQIEGGVAQGIGWTLTENLKFENGELINPHFEGYKIPTIIDVPKITSIMIETNDAKGPYGAKGIGECAMVPTAPAIVNAIYDAIGVRIKELPASPEIIIRALKARCEERGI